MDKPVVLFTMYKFIMNKLMMNKFIMDKYAIFMDKSAIFMDIVYAMVISENPMYDYELRIGAYLCRDRIIPMNQKVIRRVQGIYDYGMMKNQMGPNDNNTLIIASHRGLVDMVWGFIECAKQTNTNLSNGKRGEFQEFLWLRNKLNETALDVAIKEGHVEVAKLLLENASFERLVTERNHEGKLPVSMLANQHDMFIWSTLEKATTAAAVDPPASTLIWIGEENQRQVYTESIMDPESYPHSHKHELRDSLEKLHQGILELTPNKNTILHLVSHNGDIKYALDILEKHPSLVYHYNSEGETPAYVAARQGHVDILAVIISYLRAKKANIESLLVRSIDKHTALHIAIQNRHVGVVFWLIKEIPQLVNLINDFNESPIYLTAERGYYHLVGQTLNKCQRKSFKGPKGKSALHAAAISGSRECIQYLLREKIDQKVCDEHGWTPLQYAVHHNNAKAAAELVKALPSIAYEIIIENDIKTSAIHIAASRGYLEVLEALMSQCPGCAEVLDGKGKNMFHVAVENKKTEVIQFICQHVSYESLVNKKDQDGNTPIRLLMGSDLETMDLVMDGQTHDPLDMASSKDIKRRLLEGIAMGVKVKDTKKNEQRMKADTKRVENFLIVATLIATASFAAAFTVPGGFNGNEGSGQGMPILLRKAAFKAFMISNTLASSCSVAVLYLHLTILFFNNEHFNIHMVAEQMSAFTMYALFAMISAFATGIYVVLRPGLAIFLCTLAIVLPLLAPYHVKLGHKEKVKHDTA